MIRDREKRVIIEQQGRDVKDFAMLSILTNCIKKFKLDTFMFKNTEQKILSLLRFISNTFFSAA